jgi:dephospho-CoA kinase
MSTQRSRPPDDRIVIGIAGRIGAGKTSVAKYLEAKYEFFYIRYSQVLSDWKARDPESRAHLQAVGWEVMAGGMQQELNDRLIASIGDRAKCAVDGLRHPLDYSNLSRKFSEHFHLVFIESPAEVRWKRLHEKDPKKYPDRQTFDDADLHLVEQQIDSLRNRAEFLLVNGGSREELYEAVDAILSKVSGGQL